MPTTPQVGTVDCDFLRGTAPVLTTRTREWQIEGFNGYNFQVLGSGHGEFRIQVELYYNNEGVKQWFSDLEALQGTVVTITDHDGNQYQNCFISRVERSPIRAARRFTVNPDDDGAFGVCVISGTMQEPAS